MTATEWSAKRLMIAADRTCSETLNIYEFALIYLVSDTFRVLDKNGDNDLSLSELDDYFASIKVDGDDNFRIRLLRIADDDKTGRLNLDEFVFLHSACLLFRQVDKLHAKKLTNEQVSDFFSSDNFELPGGDLNPLLDAVDENSNSTLELDEFLELYHVFKFFRSLDKDKRFFITLAQLRQYLNEESRLPHDPVSDKDVRRLKIAVATNYKDDNVSIVSFAHVYRIFANLRSFDSDRNYLLDTKELDAYFKYVGMVFESNCLDRLIAAIEEDNRGKLNLVEFSYVVRAARLIKKYRAAIGSQNLSINEVKAFLESEDLNLSEEQLASVVKAFDLDGSGVHDLPKFTRLYQSCKYFKGLFMNIQEPVTLERVKTRLEGQRKISVAEEELVRAFNVADSERNRVFTYPEFVTFYGAVYNRHEEQVDL